MKTNKIIFALASFGLFIAGGCNKQLDLFPLNDTTSDKVYSSLKGYQQSLAKVYGSFAATGSGGPGSTDLPFGGDAGWSDFFRSFWKAQQLTTDEAAVAWTGDAGLQDFNTISYSSNNPFIQRNFSRPLFQIVIANEFIRECADNRLSDRGIGGNDANLIRRYKQEARFLRAFQYWVLLDLFRNPPFVTELNDVGKFLPPQTNAVALYNYIETELLDLANTLPPPRSVEYGHADRAAAWALLARLSLNAQVYTGTPKFEQAMTYSKKVIDEGGYALAENYSHLFGANNDSAGIRQEFIFSILYDGINTQTFGGTTFLINASGSNTTRNIFGLSGGNGGWSGLRAKMNLPLLFPDTGKSANPPDKRAMFITDNRVPEISNLADYTQGFVVRKFRNITSGNQFGRNRTAEFCDTDMPLFRLPEMYFIFAEADLRMGGGNAGQSVNYINQLRERAYGGREQGQISSADLTLDFILDERSRELYWEGHRRTDLIRYGRFSSGTYLWPFKGGILNGRAVSDHLQILPIPATELSSNPNLKQNPGY